MGFHGVHMRMNYYILNRFLSGTNFWKLKRYLLTSIGHKIGENTKIVGPIHCSGMLEIGDHVWVGRNFTVNGNGRVVIGNHCDIAPDVEFNTGGHEIGLHEHRAGIGKTFCQIVGNGVWIGARTTIINDTVIGDGAVIAACACVVKDIEADTLVGGVPARVIRKL